MNAAILALVAAAIGLALSPVGLAKMILVLFSRRRTVNAIAFVVALLLGSVVAILIGVIGGSAADDGPSGPSTITLIVLLGLGLLLVVLSVTNWRNRRDESAPKILGAIEEMGPMPVALLAVSSALVNPKNVVLLIAVGDIIIANWSRAAAGPVVVAFVLVATLPYTAITAYALVGGAGATAHLDALRDWLIGRNRLIVAIVAGMVGALMLLRGLTGLLG
jgi:hypothetical protein